MNFWKISTFALTGCLAAIAVYATAVPAHADPPGPQPQPKMQSALTHLKAAKADLQSATEDKGGHRVKAIAATNEAIEQTEKGINFDNKH